MGNIYHFLSIDAKIKVGIICLVVLFLGLILAWKVIIGRYIMILVNIAGICGFLACIGEKYGWSQALIFVLNGIGVILFLVVLVLVFLLTKGVIKITAK